MSWHCLLLELHPMAGLDLHMELTATPPAPVPAPFIPHMVGMLLHGMTPLGPSMTTRSKTAANHLAIVQKGSDMGFLIFHLPVPVWPPTLLAALCTALSGSKSYFGPTSVVAEGTPVAAALIPMSFNINLNCGTVPTPTGYIFAPSTVVTGMTWGDILGGIVAMVVDCAVQAAMNKLCGFIGPVKATGKLTPAIASAINNVIQAVVQQITGSPVGYTFSVPGHTLGDSKDPTNPWNPGNWGNWLGDKVQKGIDGPGPSTSPSQPASVNPGTSPHPGATDPGVENH